jgi:hypothetical protein
MQRLAKVIVQHRVDILTDRMESPFRISHIILLLICIVAVTALKFDIQAHPGHESASKERCIRNFVAKDQLVVVTAIISGSRGDGQTLNMHVSKDELVTFDKLIILTCAFEDQGRCRQ